MTVSSGLRRLTFTTVIAAAVLMAGACGSTSEAEDSDAGDSSASDAAPDSEGSVDSDTDQTGSSASEVLEGERAPEGAGSFVDATSEYGLEQALTGIRGHAVATADVNGDGWSDLFVGTFADRPLDSYQVRGAEGPAPDRLLLGSADGFSVDPDFEGRLGRSSGALFDDLDDDGDPDLVVSRNVRDSDRGDAPTELYRNDDGVLVPAAVLDDDRGGRAMATIDFDADGRRDLVLVEDRWSGGSTAIFHNDGNLGFTEANAEAGFPDDVFGLGVAVGDLNGDDVDDLVVGGSNRWFLGTGSGFVEGASSPLPWELHGDEDDPAHVVLHDVDDDGDLDVFIGQHFNSTVDASLPEPVRLFVNDGAAEPAFEDSTDAVGLPALSTKSPQLLLEDLDDDGRDEVVMTASLAGDSGRLPLVIDDASADGPPSYGSGTDETDAALSEHYWIDAVALDANRDGRIDLFFVEWEPAESAMLFLNVAGN